MDENKDILQMLREREDEFRLPLKPGSWEKLESDLNISSAEKYSLSRDLRRSLKKWGAVAALFLMCLLVSVPFLIRKERKIIGPDEGNREASICGGPLAGSESSKTDSLANVSFLAVQSRNTYSVHVPSALPEFIVTDTVMPSLRPVEIEGDSPSQSAPEAGITCSSGKKQRVNGPEVDKRYKFQTSGKDPDKNKKIARWAVGIQMGSNTLASPKGGLESLDDDLTSPGKPGGPDKHPDPDKEHPDTRAAVGGGPGSEGGTGITYFYHHRLPITVSLSVRRYLSPSFALESGISYSYLYSEITEQGSHQIGSQKLHYLGIPLKASWTFFKKEHMSFYLSGGGMLEYGVSLRKNNSDLHINRWQPSLNATVGMQVELVRPLSLFIEPGIGYYPNINRNNGALAFNCFESIRTVHPFTFSLQVGIRFSY